MNDTQLQTQELIDSIKKLTVQIQKNNENSTENIKKNTRPHTFSYYIKRYIQEILEASFGLIMVIFILKKEFSLLDFIKITSIIALITLILEEYNIEYLNNFKQGIHFTLGSLAFT